MIGERDPYGEPIDAVNAWHLSDDPDDGVVVSLRPLGDPEGSRNFRLTVDAADQLMGMLYLLLPQERRPDA